MFKKFALAFIVTLLGFCPVFADEIEDVKTFFDDYVNAANNYSKEVVNFYLPDAKIIRVVIKPDGSKQSVSFPMERYEKELKKGRTLAKLSRYKNKYINRKVEKLDNGDYKITATRIASFDKDNKGHEFYFVVTDTNNGLKVKEESMETTVQKFLNSK